MSPAGVAPKGSRPNVMTRLLAIATALITITPFFMPAPASAYWSVSTSTLSVGSAKAPTVNRGKKPTATVANKNQVEVSWDASTLSNSAPITGYTVTRYDSNNSPATMEAGSGCAGTVAELTCTEEGVPDGLWTYRITPRIGQNWVGEQSAPSEQVLTDKTAPTNSITVVPQAGVFQASKNQPVWVRTNNGAGSLVLSNALTDSGSGPASSASELNPATGSGFSHTPGRVNTPQEGSYLSARYAWSADATGAPTAKITGRDSLGNIAVTDILIKPDNTAPTGGAISYPDGVPTDRNITISLASISDNGGSGVSAGTRVLQSQWAPLTGNQCGTFGNYVDLVTKPVASQTVVAEVGCTKYRYKFADNVGNVLVTGNPRTVIVKPPLTYAETVTATGGLLSFWRLEGTGTTLVADSGPKENPIRWGIAQPPVQGGAIAESTGSVLFNGTSDYGAARSDITGDFSIEFWFKSNQGLGTTSHWSDGAGLVDASQPGLAADFGVSLMADGRVVAGTGNPDVFVASGVGKNNGEWHHVVFTRELSGVLTLYVDGELVSSKANGGTQSLNTGEINFGRIRLPDNYYSGNLDEIAVYNTALPPETVQNHYTVGKRPLPTP